MIVFEDHSYQQDSLFPDSNYLKEIPDIEQPKWVVSDESELANKIKNTPFWTPVENQDGELIDIETCDRPLTIDEEIEVEKEKLSAIDFSSIRALRAIVDRTDTEEDWNKLHELEQDAQTIRTNINLLFIKKNNISNPE